MCDGAGVHYLSRKESLENILGPAGHFSLINVNSNGIKNRLYLHVCTVYFPLECRKMLALGFTIGFQKV